jgi:hypothetical protein
MTERGRYTIAAQLSTVHSSDENLDPRRVAGLIGGMTKEVPLDILVVGWTERPELFRMLTAPGTRLSKEVFLWYPLLSDYPGFDPSHLIVTSNSLKSRGWTGYEGTGIAESFKQACPNNPQTVSCSMARLEEYMTVYGFDGVFIDKIRFPSMANGLQDVFSCFCPYCVKKAARSGLDLEEVRAVLAKGANRSAAAGARTTERMPAGADWLEELVEGQPLLQRFIRFRADSISELVATVSERMRKIGKKVSLDVFSPMLAPLVGQDFAALARHADWVKPMIYRFGSGPSSLRTEIPSLVRELGGYLGCGEKAAMSWAAARVEGLKGMTLEQVEEVAPLSLLRGETARALRLFAGTSLYLGLESVFIPGRMGVQPRHVEEILDIGTQAGVQGFVLSWDLLHTPIANVMPLRSLRAG